MKRPLLPVALLYAGGLLLAKLSEPPLALLFTFTFMLALLALLWPAARKFLLWPLIICVGWTNLASRTAIVSPDDLRLIIGGEPAQITARGVLMERPIVRVYERAEEETWRTLARVRVTAVQRDGRWQPAHGRVAVSSPDILANKFFAGQHVEVSGVIAAPTGPFAPGLFDYRAYLRNHGIYHQLRAFTTNDWSLASSAQAARAPPLPERFRNWAQRNLARGLPAEDEPLRLLWAMTLGWKTALTGEVSEPFMRSGTLHIFAISGLHIALIAGILVALLRVARMPRAWCGGVVIPLLWFYTAATGWQPSAVRSTVMMSVILAGWTLKRPTDLLNSLCAAALIILAWEPRQLFQASFQLSFSVVLSMALILPPLEKFRNRVLRIDPLLPPELLLRWQRWSHEAIRWITTSLAVSFAAWLGSLPLTAYYFHLFTPVSLIANVVVVPLSALALASSMGSLLVGGWFPALAELFNHSGWMWMKWMITVSEWAADLPFAYRYVPPPSPAGFVLYFALLISVSAGWLFRPRWRIPVLSLLLAAGLLAGFQSRASANKARLTVIPLAGGHATYFHGKTGERRLLIDCGDTNAVESITLPFLRAQGVNHLPALALTHGDLRHVGGAEILFHQLDIGRVLTSAVRFRSTTYRTIVDQLPTTGRQHGVIHSNDTFGPWTVLHPARGDKVSQADDGALVLRGEFNGLRVLLLSDLGRAGQEQLLERHEDLRADIVFTGLPAQSEPLAGGLLDRIQPAAIVVVDSLFPATARAKDALRERLRLRGVPLLFTADAGAVTLTITPRCWELKGMDGSRISGQPAGR